MNPSFRVVLRWFSVPAAWAVAAAWVVLGAFLPALHGAGADAAPPTPMGLWKTFDDKTGKARALVRIYEQDGKYFGRIEQSFTAGAETRVCVPCTDSRKNQPIIGLIVIRNIQFANGEYAGGDILDPESGAVYRCKLHLEQDGARLIVRGYFGIPLLGRSQTWARQ